MRGAATPPARALSWRPRLLPWDNMFKRMAEFGPDSGGRVKVSAQPRRAERKPGGALWDPSPGPLPVPPETKVPGWPGQPEALTGTAGSEQIPPGLSTLKPVLIESSGALSFSRV